MQVSVGLVNESRLSLKTSFETNPDHPLLIFFCLISAFEKVNNNQAYQSFLKATVSNCEGVNTKKRG